MNSDLFQITVIVTAYCYRFRVYVNCLLRLTRVKSARIVFSVLCLLVWIFLFPGLRASEIEFRGSLHAAAGHKVSAAAERFGVHTRYKRLVGGGRGYRTCPMAIAPNLSDLQPTVQQITVGGIERGRRTRTTMGELRRAVDTPDDRTSPVPICGHFSDPLSSRSSTGSG